MNKYQQLAHTIHNTKLAPTVGLSKEASHQLGEWQNLALRAALLLVDDLKGQVFIQAACSCGKAKDHGNDQCVSCFHERQLKNVINDRQAVIDSKDAELRKKQDEIDSLNKLHGILMDQTSEAGGEIVELKKQITVADEHLSRRDRIIDKLLGDK